MLVLMKAHPGPGLKFIDVPVPSPDPTEVLVEIRSTGIYGTDVHIDRWNDWAARTVTTPLVLEHEFCGTIVELGSAVTSLEVGQFISGRRHYVCGRYRVCLAGKRHLYQRTREIGYHVDGAFREYFTMPAVNIWVHPSKLNPDVTTIFDPFDNAVHVALQLLALAEDALVAGAGPIGIMAALVTKFQGAQSVVTTDLSDERLALTETLDITSAVSAGQEDLEEIHDRLSMKEGFDIGLEMSGSGAALRSMIDHTAHGDRIALLGTSSQELTVDFSKIIFSMPTIRSVTGRQIFETWYAMNALIRSGPDVPGVITHRFSVTELAEAFAVARDDRSSKIVMH